MSSNTHLLWEALQDTSSLHKSSTTNVANVLKISLSAHKGSEWTYCSAIKTLDVGPDRICTYSEIIAVTKMSALNDALMFIRETEEALERVTPELGCAVWSDIDLARYGVTVFNAYPLMRLTVEGSEGRWIPIVYTACDRQGYRLSTCEELYQAKYAAKAGAYTMLGHAKEQVQEALETEHRLWRLVHQKR